MALLQLDANSTLDLLKIAKDELTGNTKTHKFDELYHYAKGIGQFFYLIDHNDTSFENINEVPNYFHQAWPYFLFFIILENFVLLAERKPRIRLNDTLTSLSNGLIHETGRLLFRSGESLAYVYIYENFCMINLKWDSPYTWYGAAIGVDFCYYWVHRASHEIHILWAQHQVHHSSEEFNLAVGLRQSILHRWCGFLFYLPLALVIPPAHFLTHQQFSLLYQFWIHTKTISTLGPLEFIFNTPKHHRVHHGCNKYCLDKNYGGFLIIWDRLFGTFVEEREMEEIVYGLVINQPSFNPLHLQTFYTRYVYNKMQSYATKEDRIAAVLAGPSWSPGTPRLGDEREKLDIRYREKYDVILPTWSNIYLFLHFCAVVYGFQELTIRHMGMSPLSVFVFVCYILTSLTSIGLMFDRHPTAAILELTRCALFSLMSRGYEAIPEDKNKLFILQLFYLTSAIWWCLKISKIFNPIEKKTE